MTQETDERRAPAQVRFGEENRMNCSLPERRQSGTGRWSVSPLGLCRLGLVILVGFAFTAGQAPRAHAQEILEVDSKSIVLNLNEAKFLRLERPASAIFLSNPNVADIDLQSASYIYLVGKAVGESTLFVLGDDDQPMMRTTVSVGVDAERLTRAVLRSVSGGRVNVSSVDGAIFLRGVVPSPDDIATAEDVLAALTGPNAIIVNRLELEQSAQVNLQVKIAEVSRTVSDDLGFGINGSGARGTFSSPVSSIENGFAVSVTPSGLNMNLMLDALSQRGLVSILSEPNLTARSGETAEFLAGGQIPYRVGDSADDTRIELQPFGVELEFTPVVRPGGQIEINLETRVREVDSSSSTDSDIGPALTERSASTTVEIGSGQSFAIAGMFQSGTRQSLGGLPGLVNLPIIGALFRSSDYSRGETELVIIVTPYLVKPTSPRELSLPTDTVNTIGGVEQWGTGQFTRPLKPARNGRSRERSNSGGFRLQ